MLDDKRYYTVFPDEDPELRPRVRAVLDALAICLTRHLPGGSLQPLHAHGR
jgi:hypothetical protein